ncbi:MAG TPA: heavy-metal-associated domain-containing protein [bacterium]|nr:heavy-metal-associated domain-containing protein [bacterium]
MSQAVFNIDGMTCDHCVRAVTEALKGVAGVREAEVNLKDRLARVTYEGGLETPAVLRAVEEAGYRASPAESRP